MRSLPLILIAMLVGCSLLSPAQRVESRDERSTSQRALVAESVTAEAKSTAAQTGAFNSVVDYAVAGVGGTTILALLSMVMYLNYKSKALDLRSDELRETTYIVLEVLRATHAPPDAFWLALAERLSASR